MLRQILDKCLELHQNQINKWLKDDAERPTPPIIPVLTNVDLTCKFFGDYVFRVYVEGATVCIQLPSGKVIPQKACNVGSNNVVQVDVDNYASYTHQLALLLYTSLFDPMLPGFKRI